LAAAGLEAVGFVVSGFVAAGLAFAADFANEIDAAAKSTVRDRVAILKIRFFIERDSSR
jgi:hypothetical protein